jgi:hypothetical protein
MFGQSTQDESDLLHFLPCTGAREQEARFAYIRSAGSLTLRDSEREREDGSGR